MSPLSTICLTDPSAGLFVKSCWLFHLIRSSRRPDCSVPVRQRVHAVACYSALCVEWRDRGLVHAHPVHLVALTAQYLHFVRVLFPSEERFFVVLVRYLPFDHIFFFHPLRLLYIFFGQLHRVHLRPYCKHFFYRLSAALVLHLSQDLFVSVIVKWVVFGVVACVVQP